MYFWPNKMFVREFAWFVFIPTLSFKMLTFYLNSLKEKKKAIILRFKGIGFLNDVFYSLLK